MKFFRNYNVLIPSNETTVAICDYVHQTASILAQHTDVYIISNTNSLISEHNQLSSRLSKSYTVLQTRKFVPGNRYYTIRLLNFLLSFCYYYIKIKNHSGKRILLWQFFPDFFYLLPLIKMLGEKSVFDIVDYFTSPVLKRKLQIRKHVNTMIELSDLVVTNSLSLQKAHQFHTTKKIHLVPQGFSLDIFESSISKKAQFVDQLVKHNSPIVGFVGAINGRIDYKLINEVAKKQKKWLFVFVGPAETDHNVETYQKKDLIRELKKNKNIVFIPAIPKNEIPSVVSVFDVCMIPYDIKLEFNRMSFPMKIFEYFYLEKPVLSTKIPEIGRLFPLAYSSNKVENWVTFLEKVEKYQWPKKIRLQQQKSAKKHSWFNKVHSIGYLFQHT